MTEREQQPNRIPEFSSIVEEAEFWDTHDTTDFEAEFHPVRVRFRRNLAHGLTIRVDAETLDKLRTLAEEKGIGPTTLVRMWVLERLRQEAASAKPQRRVAERKSTYKA